MSNSHILEPQNIGTEMGAQAPVTEKIWNTALTAQK